MDKNLNLLPSTKFNIRESLLRDRVKPRTLQLNKDFMMKFADIIFIEIVATLFL